MKITKVQPFLMSCPLPEPLRLTYYGGERTILKRDAMVIRIQTDSGLTGYAPCEAGEKAHRAIATTIAAFLQGETLCEPETLRARFLANQDPDSVVSRAYSAVEIALCDLYGKLKGLPVSELIGGRVRDRIRLYGSAGMYMPPEKFAQEAAAIARLGFTAYKMRPGLGPEADLEAARLVRDALGPGSALMLDAHSWWRMGNRNYSPETVERLTEALGEYQLTWLEEPLLPDDHAAYRRLRQKYRVPLASGEHEPNEARFMDLITSRSVDYVQMDVCGQGGYSLGRRLLAAIAREGLHFAFHCWGTELEVLAAAHLGVCWPESVVSWLEYPCFSTPSRAGMYPFPLALEVLKQPLAIDRGDLVVPQGPGLGVEVDESVFERYPWTPGPWSLFHFISPDETWAVCSDHSSKWSGRVGQTAGAV